MKPLIEVNKFEIIDMPGMNTIAFTVEKNLTRDNIENYSLQKVDHIDNEQDGKLKKTFNVISAGEEKQMIVLLTLTKSKVILSTGELTKEGFEATESNIPLTYGTIFNQDNVEYKEVNYTPNMKRNFCIVDTQTGEEVKPSIYMDNQTNELKGSCKILPHRTYVVLELTEDEEEEV